MNDTFEIKLIVKVTCFLLHDTLTIIHLPAITEHQGSLKRATKISSYRVWADVPNASVIV